MKRRDFLAGAAAAALVPALPKVTLPAPFKVTYPIGTLYMHYPEGAGKSDPAFIRVMSGPVLAHMPPNPAAMHGNQETLKFLGGAHETG